jgi:uncharacterized protein
VTAGLPCQTSSVPSLIPAAAGIGLREPHHHAFKDEAGRVAWLEVHPENYMTDSSSRSELDRIAALYPLSLHAVGLSLGSSSTPHCEHLRLLGELVERYQPGLISDHLAWNAIDGVHLPDLLPLPYTEEALQVVTRNVEYVQHTLRRRILLENPSKYLQLPQTALTEAQFLAEVVARTDCGVLLDLNNIFVSATNSNAAAGAQLEEFLACIPAASIAEIHLAGHGSTQLPDGRTLLLDDHGAEICPQVWGLFEQAARVLGPKPTLIEWDTRLPDLQVLLSQANIAQSVIDVTQDKLAQQAACAMTGWHKAVSHAVTG